MKFAFWKKGQCPLFHGLGSCVVCLIPKTPELVMHHCKRRKDLCSTIVRFGLPNDVKLRKGEHYREKGAS